MKSIVVLLIAILALAVLEQVKSADLTVHEFETRVDHFRTQDNRVVNFVS